MKKNFRVVFLFLPVWLAGCITTNVKGYTDSDFNDYKIMKVIVRAPGMNFSSGELFEISMVKALHKAGIKADSFLKKFPPTRQWTNKQVTNELASTGFDSIMHINFLGSNTSTQTFGYTNSGNAYTYGNSNLYSDTTTEITTFRRYTSTRVKIYDVKTAKIIWIGDTRTNAGGVIYMGDKTTSDDIANEVVVALKRHRHL